MTVLIVIALMSITLALAVGVLSVFYFSPWTFLAQLTIGIVGGAIAMVCMVLLIMRLPKRDSTDSQ
jgi:hypothetical protein